jgi:hypothetical protein
MGFFKNYFPMPGPLKRIENGNYQNVLPLYITQLS